MQDQETIVEEVARFNAGIIVLAATCLFVACLYISRLFIKAMAYLISAFCHGLSTATVLGSILGVFLLSIFHSNYLAFFVIFMIIVISVEGMINKDQAPFRMPYSPPSGF